MGLGGVFVYHGQVATRVFTSMDKLIFSLMQCFQFNIFWWNLTSPKPCIWKSCQILWQWSQDYILLSQVSESQIIGGQFLNEVLQLQWHYSTLRLHILVVLQVMACFFLSHSCWKAWNLKTAPIQNGLLQTKTEAILPSCYCPLLG